MEGFLFSLQAEGRADERPFDLRGSGTLAYQPDNIIALTGKDERMKKLHFVKLDFCPVQLPTPLDIEFRPGLPTPFDRAGKMKIY